MEGILDLLLSSLLTEFFVVVLVVVVVTVVVCVRAGILAFIFKLERRQRADRVFSVEDIKDKQAISHYVVSDQLFIASSLFSTLPPLPSKHLLPPLQPTSRACDTWLARCTLT